MERSSQGVDPNPASYKVLLRQISPSGEETSLREMTVIFPSVIDSNANGEAKVKRDQPTNGCVVM